MKGPTPVTVDDMWRMIWEQRCYSIVMVTSLFELGKVSVCALVYPYYIALQVTGTIGFAA